MVTRKETEYEINIAMKFSIEEVADYILSKAMENIVKYDAVYTGHLLRSGKIDPVSDIEMDVIFDVPYAGDVEYGVLPHERKAPVEAITKWVKRRLGVTNEQQARSIAFAVCKKIYEKGIPPRPFLRDAVSDCKKKYK